MARRRPYRGIDAQHRALYLREARQMRNALARARSNVASDMCSAAFNRLRDADIAYGKMQAHGLAMDARGSAVNEALETARTRFRRKCLR